MSCRSRNEKRAAAREREAEMDKRLRQLHNLSAKLTDKCQVVSSYEEAGKAERLKQVSSGLHKLSQQLKEEEAKLKVRLCWNTRSCIPNLHKCSEDGIGIRPA